jgi:Tol biopolymer transport system component
MNALVIFLITLLPVLAYSQMPFSNYVATNAGKSINTEHTERFPMVLSDGLTLFFSSNRPGGHGDLDIYVCTRKTLADQWSEPMNLGTHINSRASDHSVTVSEDGHWMIFTSEKEGSYGTADLYLSYREDISKPLGWGEAKNAGSAINKVENKDSIWTACPLFHEENGHVNVYFTSNRSGAGDVYVSSYANGKFTTPVLIQGINTEEGEYHFAPDEGFIWTNRNGGFGGSDIWITTKRKGSNEWSTPIPLGSNINTSSNEGMPSITKDKSLFVFDSDKPGGEGKEDIYFAQPSK